ADELSAGRRHHVMARGANVQRSDQKISSTVETAIFVCTLLRIHSRPVCASVLFTVTKFGLAATRSPALALSLLRCGNQS
ncbi:MAG TPA: hypothetical protein VK665_07515, partial [Candidatus Elarobacter sp.]|nr:hypothetical protein [Candidatus Elarobacter sp.]